MDGLGVYMTIDFLAVDLFMNRFSFVKCDICTIVKVTHVNKC